MSFMIFVDKIYVCIECVTQEEWKYVGDLTFWPLEQLDILFNLTLKR